MLNPTQIIQSAGQILRDGGHKPTLHPQLIALTEAICEAVNNEMKLTRTKKPTLDEVLLLGAKAGLAEADCLEFFNHYESNGWKVGKVPMKSVGHAIGTWKSNLIKFKPIVNGAKTLFEMQTILKAKEALAQQIKARCYYPDQDRWSFKDDAERDSYNQLRKSIRAFRIEIAMKA